MAALMATFSTVAVPPFGCIPSKITWSGASGVPASSSRTRSSVGGSSGSPSPQPSSIDSSYSAYGSASTTMRSLASMSVTGSALHAEHRQQLRIELAGDLADLGLRPLLERVRQHQHVEVRMLVVFGHAVGEVLERAGHHGDR